MRVIVCGGRDFDDYDLLKKSLDEFNITEICNGGASGADKLSTKYAEEKNIPITIFFADWEKHGKAAGMIRNKRMLDEFKPDMVIAFKGGKGTKNMEELALKSWITVCKP